MVSLCGNGLNDDNDCIDLMPPGRSFHSLIADGINPLPNNKILDLSKLKEFAEENFEFDKNGRKFSKRAENILEKGEIARNEQFFIFFHRVFKILVLQTRKNQDLFGNGLKN